MSDSNHSVLFICLGNICRSPMAHAVFLEQIKKANAENQWKVDSAALGSWHVGNQPDSRALQVLRQNGISFSHAVRQIRKVDFNEYEYIFGMDDDNMRALQSMAPKGSRAKVLLLGSFDPNGELTIRDPYYDDGNEGFHKVYEQCVRACQGFLQSVTQTS